MMSERVAVVDEHNLFVRWAQRAEVHADRLPHRSVQVLLFDSAGRLVLQRRDASKLTHPLHWDISASGHVEEADYPDPTRPDEGLDAIYDAVALRELEEELGVSTPLSRLGAFRPQAGIHYEHFVLYRGTSDGPYVLQRGEVESVRAFEKEDFDVLARGTEPLTASLVWLVGWARRHGVW